MAEIKMDISEYEAIKENKKLLEKALEKEELLNKEIIRLKEEKVQALESAKMKVVKTVKKQVTEHALMKVTPQQAMIYMRDFFYQVKDNQYRNAMGYVDDMYKSLIDVCFSRTTSIGSPETVEITTVGLEEVKQEIQQKLEEDLKEKIQNLESIAVEYETLSKEVKVIKRRNGVLETDNLKLKEKIEELEKGIETSNIRNKSNREKYKKIQDAVYMPYNYFNSFFKLDKIKNIINE